jgi:Flp pilus assembly protein TadB
MGGITLVNPEYLLPLFETETGHIMLAGRGYGC